MVFRFETERFDNGVNCIVSLKSDIGESPYRTNFFAETDLDMVEGLSYFTNTHSVFMHSAMDFYKAPDHIIRKAVDRLEWLVRGGWMRDECFVDNFEKGIEDAIEEEARELENQSGYFVRTPLNKFDCKAFSDWDAVKEKEFMDELNNRLQQTTVEKERTVSEIFNGLPDEQKNAVYFVIAKALEDAKTTVKEETKVEMEFETSNYCAYEPVKVWYNPPYTTVEFDDGDKVTTKCQDGDTFSKAAGFAICCLKKELGGWTEATRVIGKCEYRANRKKLIREAQKRARKERNEYARKREAEAKKQRHEALVRKFYEERKAKDEALTRFYEHEAKRNESKEDEGKCQA